MASSPPFALVIGGTGRVGTAVSASLLALHPSMRVHIAGRNRARGEAVCTKLGATRTQFTSVDITKYESIVAAMNFGLLEGSAPTAAKPCCVVINCAGPFQENTDPAVLRACIETRTPHLDVCDDAAFGRVARKLHSDAEKANVPCITTGGLFPGLSNVLARELMESIDGGVGGTNTVEFDYWCAGTGGLGTTVLTTSFMILRIPATNYRAGKAYKTIPMSYEGSRVCNFLDPIGPRRTYLFDLPEVDSIHASLSIPTVEARFATAPDFFNANMRLLAEQYGEQLKDRALVERVVWWQEPFIRAVDWFVGEGVGMKIRVSAKESPAIAEGAEPATPESTLTAKGRDGVVPGAATATYTASFCHPSTVEAIGRAVAAMALTMTPVGAECATVSAEGVAGGAKVKAGVWWPEQAYSTSEDRRAYARWAVGSAKFELGVEWW